MRQPSAATKFLLTTAVVVAGFGSAGWKFWTFWQNPWTRNGQVMAQVIQVTPRVSGPLVQLPIIDNQFVNKGDLLFEIDPRTFQSSLDGAQGNLAETIDEIEALSAQVEATRTTIEQYEAAIRRAEQQVIGKRARLKDYQRELARYSEMVKSGAASQERVEQAEADVVDAEAWVDGSLAELEAARAAKAQAEADLARDVANRGVLGAKNARLKTAKAQVHSAELQLEFTEVRAPVDGYITNLDLRLGDQAVANKAALALVDVDSFWVYGFFKEHYTGNIQLGDEAVVTLMSHQGTPLKGRVTGKGWGIYQSDGSTSQQLLPSISATFEWVRQPQRVPVRVELEDLPEGFELVVGTTATVQVRTGTAGDWAAPAAAQRSQPLEPQTVLILDSHGSHGSDSHGSDSHGSDSHGSGSHGSDSHGSDSHGSDSHGSDSHGSDTGAH